jgi:hypothetical protein
MTLQNLTLFLVLSSYLSSCASKPVVTSFDGNWKFVETAPGKKSACLEESDVMKLREILIRCESGNK